MPQLVEVLRLWRSRSGTPLTDDTGVIGRTRRQVSTRLERLRRQLQKVDEQLESTASDEGPAAKHERTRLEQQRDALTAERGSLDGLLLLLKDAQHPFIRVWDGQQTELWQAFNDGTHPLRYLIVGAEDRDDLPTNAAAYPLDALELIAAEELAEIGGQQATILNDSGLTLGLKASVSAGLEIEVAPCWSIFLKKVPQLGRFLQYAETRMVIEADFILTGDLPFEFFSEAEKEDFSPTVTLEIDSSIALHVLGTTFKGSLFKTTLLEMPHAGQKAAYKWNPEGKTFLFGDRMD